MEANRWHHVLALAIGLGVCQLLVTNCSASEADRLLLRSLDKFAHCIIEASFSSIRPNLLPPTSESDLKRLCKSQSEAFQCIKEKSKNVTNGLIRRGMVTFVGARQRHHRKYCTSPNSDVAQKFIAANKCFVEKRFKQYRQIEGEMAQTLFEIGRRNYTDSAMELKQMCCNFHVSKSKMLATIEPDCSGHRLELEELFSTIIPEDLKLVCDDEDKLAQVCNKLQPLQFKRIENYQPPKGKPVASLLLYLFTTLGDPNDMSSIN